MVMDLVAVVLAVEEELQAGNYNKSELILVDVMDQSEAVNHVRTTINRSKRFDDHRIKIKRTMQRVRLIKD